MMWTIIHKVLGMMDNFPLIFQRYFLIIFKGLVRFKIGTNVRLLWKQWWTLGFRDSGKFFYNMSDHKIVEKYSAPLG